MSQLPKQENVFSQIKKNTARGRGLSNPTECNISTNNIAKDEHSEAVDVSPKRNMRIGTYITEEASDMLDAIIIKKKKMTKKKPKIAEVIELAITELYQKINKS